eukprot:CAMPEP_0194215680 /NCGR_PEP_ID=MMETSP0156-20130528/17656_1 /TAXON_ID=33649 /ORGANISM="Thalassionema nitzschioides, Strain L26-B" /LENGTH=237 /DNA_ID=CAMNT_0038944257 /DNA_START=20 /DNA_END=736 /DNA_ORIENTATION=+
MRNFHTLSIFTLLLLIKSVNAAPKHFPLAAPSLSFTTRRRGGMFRNDKDVLLASAERKSSKAGNSARPLVNIPSKEISNEEAMPTWDDLGFGWKVVFGGLELATTIAGQWLSGYALAYVASSLTGVIGLAKAPTDELTRLARWRQRNNRWGQNWASINAAFSGFDVGVRLLRNNKQDEWNSLFSTAFAGAFFVRNKGPEAMVKSAVMYAAFGFFMMRLQVASNSGNPMFLEERALEN